MRRESWERANWLVGLIKDFIRQSPENTLKNREEERAFEDVLVGFARGYDPLFADYKEHVGPFHWTPEEAFREAFPQTSAAAAELTVISWILPQNRATKRDNRREKRFPAERWARARIMGEEVNEKLRRHVTAEMERAGYAALAPVLLPSWSRAVSEKYGFASKWSERHAAYAAGLGTFGLCDGLITPLGKAMRTGSVIARIDLDPTPRLYTDHHEYCLFYHTGRCGVCITRCPVQAISEHGKDKILCDRHLRPDTAQYVHEHYGFEGFGCGLCQTGVPCESLIPVREARKRAAEWWGR